MKYLPSLLLLLLLFCLPARAETFKDDDNAFSIDIPEGWTPMSMADVRAATALLSPDPNLRCFAGFEHGQQGLLLISTSTYPQAKSYDSLSFLQIQQLATALTEVPAAQLHTATRPVISNMAAGTTRQITCFTTPPGFAIDLQQPKDNTRSHSLAYLGRDHVIFLHFFMKTDDYPFVKRSMDEIAASFQFRLGQSLATKTTFDDPHNYANWGLYFFVAVFVAAAVYIVRYLFKRKAY